MGHMYASAGYFFFFSKERTESFCLNFHVYVCFENLVVLVWIPGDELYYYLLCFWFVLFFRLIRTCR